MAVWILLAATSQCTSTASHTCSSNDNALLSATLSKLRSATVLPLPPRGAAGWRHSIAPDAARQDPVDSALRPTARDFEALGDFLAAQNEETEAVVSPRGGAASRLVVRAWSIALHMNPTRMALRRKLANVNDVRLCAWEGNVMIGSGGVGSFAQAGAKHVFAGRDDEALLYFLAASARTPGVNELSLSSPAAAAARRSSRKKRGTKRKGGMVGNGRHGSDSPWLSAENAATGFTHVAKSDAFELSQSWRISLNLWALRLFELCAAAKSGHLSNHATLHALRVWRDRVAPRGSTKAKELARKLDREVSGEGDSRRPLPLPSSSTHPLPPSPPPFCRSAPRSTCASVAVDASTHPRIDTLSMRI